MLADESDFITHLSLPSSPHTSFAQMTRAPVRAKSGNRMCLSSEGRDSDRTVPVELRILMEEV